jgi:hypothetical protein
MSYLQSILKLIKGILEVKLPTRWTEKAEVGRWLLYMFLAIAH